MMSPAALEALTGALRRCCHCQDEGLIPEARPIFQIPERPVIGIFSQAPGNLAHQGGRPFMDPSGVRLRQWMGVDEPTFYDSGAVAIIPMAFCFPGYDGTGKTGKGGDLPPPKVCAEKWRAPLMDLVLPQLELVLLVGSYAQNWHLGPARGAKLSDRVGAWRERVDAWRRGEAPVLYFPMPHPSWRNTAWLKKHPWFEAEAVPVMQAVIADLVAARHSSSSGASAGASPTSSTGPSTSTAGSDATGAN